MMKIKLIISALFLMAASIVMGQKPLTLNETHYSGKNYLMQRSPAYVWWGEELMRLDKDAIYQVSKASGSEVKIITLEKVNEALGEGKVKSLTRASFPDVDKPYVMVNTGKGFEVINFRTMKSVSKVSTDGINVLEVCYGGSCFAYLKNDNLYVRDFDGKDYQLSEDGSREIVYGQSVHRNEFGIMKGTFFSPDGQQMAFYRMDQSMVADYPQVNIDPRIAAYEPDKYPMAGETSHKVTVGVFNKNTGKTIYLNLGDVTDRYFTNISWSPDSKTLYLIELNRDQTDQHLDSYNPATGEKIATLYTEHNDKYTEPQNPITFLPWDKDKFLLWSEKDGFNHLYLMNTKGEMIKQLTSGKWVVTDILGFNVKQKQVIILSREKSDIQKNIYSVDVNTGTRTLLDNGEGIHNAVLSKKGTYIIDRYSSPKVQTACNVIQTSTAKAKVLGKPSLNPWEGYDAPIVESGSIKAADDSTLLYYRMVKPHDFDPSKKYPAIVYVYGGPHARNVDASWNYGIRGWEPYMANKGYIIYILDNRGSSERGRDFEQATFRQLGQIEMLDQMKGVDFLKSLPYVDADKIGVHGWSFGGFMTISLITNYPDVFKVAVAGGPVIDWKWYEVMYGERYMDTPQQNPEGYEKTSLINRAKDLKGRLLIISGYNDATVVPQHCLSFLKACSDAGTQPDFFVYPGEEHNMRGHRSIHLHEKITRYFLDFLK